MGKCCSNELGTFVHNEEIETGIMVNQAGIHKLNMKSATGGTFVLRQDLQSGDEIKIAVGTLNESMTYSFTVIQPDGTLLVQDDCEKFTLKTIINTQIDGCTDPCHDDTDSGNAYYS